MNKLKWLFITNFGRYILGIILTIIGGVFSPQGTIDFLNTEYNIFNYILASGLLIIITQFVYHIFVALIFNIPKPKK